MPLEINWSYKDENAISEFVNGNQIVVRAWQREAARKAWRTIIELNKNLTEAYEKLEQTEKSQTSQCFILKNKIDSLQEALKRRNDSITELEEVNHSLNGACLNYDKTVSKLEKQVDELDKKCNEIQEKYNSLRSKLSILTQE